MNDLSTLKASFTVAFSIKVKSATRASYSGLKLLVCGLFIKTWALAALTPRYDPPAAFQRKR